MAEPGYPLSVARVILESESGVISETECSDILSSPVVSDPQILSCITLDSIQSTPSISHLALSKPLIEDVFILKILSEKTFDFIQEMNIKKKSM